MVRRFGTSQRLERSVCRRVEIKCRAPDEGGGETPGHSYEEETEGPAEDGGGRVVGRGGSGGGHFGGGGFGGRVGWVGEGKVGLVI